MYERYLVTGATGFLGRAVLNELLRKGSDIRALVMRNDPLESELPPGIEVVCGDVRDGASLESFFAGADGNTCVIHCAGIVSVASRPGERIYRVNAGGTNNIIRHCESSGVGKLVYVSSVHSIPERPKGVEMTEDAVFSPELVRGDYAKSKAIATALVFDAASRGLNASVVFPSGIIGPGDAGKGSITNLLLSFITGKLPIAVKGGYDFVDVRDAASGVVACSEHGEKGRGYILSGHYATIADILDAAKRTLGIKRHVTYLPITLAKLAAPLYEKWCVRRNKPLFFTPYSVAVLNSNSLFSRRAASSAFGFTPRQTADSIRDTVLWLKSSRCLPVP